MSESRPGPTNVVQFRRRALPGEEQIEETLLDRAVADLNRIHRRHALETAIEMGHYILDTFFNGDPDAFRARSRKHVTFRRLADRHDLTVSHASLWRAASIVDQLRILPADVAHRLPYTHHTLLLPASDPETKIDLAIRSADQGWSSRRLEREVARVRRAQAPDSPRVGRPPMPPVLKALGRVVCAAERVPNGPVATEWLEGCDPHKARSLVERLDEQLERLSATRDAIMGEIREMD